MSFIDALRQRRYARMMETLPNDQIESHHIQTMSIKRLARYLVWVEGNTDGIYSKLTFEKMLDMLRERQKNVGNLDMFRGLARNGLFLFKLKKLPNEESAIPYGQTIGT